MSRPEPEPHANDSRRAAAGMVAATVFLCALSASFRGTGLPVAVEFVAGAMIGTLLVGVALVLVRGLMRLSSKVPGVLVTYGLACAATLVALRSVSWPEGFFEPVSIVLRSLRFGWPEGIFYPASAIFIVGTGVIVVAIRAKRHYGLAAVSVAANLTVIMWLASSGHDPYPARADDTNIDVSPIELESPATPGSFRVETSTYGSGTDVRREEFRDGVAWKSETVDASKLLPEWKGLKARARKWYWGFSIEEAPINGRVWLPVGEGPFPLVLVVHGNHRMEEHSDPGYAYLGELLASRGLVTVSVDENFINGTWSGDFRGKEMPARGWLLLQHLRQWRRWNETPGHPMEGKADLERVALVGHSRGGEAVAIAAAFNRLTHFPDDATVPFDFDFGVRAVVAIAQTDVRYSRRIELEDVSFLALQGSYDSDEASFFGMRQFRRVAFSGDPYHFKAGLYIHRANHGQFNSVWGRSDAGPPSSWLLNLAPIISGEDQREVAKVAIAAFLEATLHDELAYVPFFRDPRRGSKWLPDGTYVHRFEDSRFVPVADFDEDIEVTTGSLDGVSIEVTGLAAWREEELRFRDDATQGTNAVVLGWKSGADEDDGEIREYALLREGGFDGLDESASLVFSASGRVDGDHPLRGPLMSVRVEDPGGESASIALATATPLKVQFLKLARWSRISYGDAWEPTLQSYEIPLERFASENPSLDVTRVSAIRFRFDASEDGGVILDDVGFRLAPAPP